MALVLQIITGISTPHIRMSIQKAILFEKKKLHFAIRRENETNFRISNKGQTAHQLKIE